jgi:hypothetical protein
VKITAGPYIAFIGEVLKASGKNRWQVALPGGLTPHLKTAELSAA